MRAMLMEVPEPFRDLCWYAASEGYAFLVDAPLTFGHSQLRISKDESEPEESVFLKAALHITTCIQTLRVRLPQAIPSWQSLAHYTNTSGEYLKTLVLKVSADEKPTEYKVHLVPFFKSHLDAANRLYRATHNQPDTKAGGLLHWLGDQEVLVDYDTRDRGSRTAQQRIDEYRLKTLAALLRGATSDAP